jgi:CIC family chloride channel protein
MENDAKADSLTELNTAPAEARTEIQEYLEVSHERHKLFPRAALVGLCAGAIAVIFRALLAGADALRGQLIGWSHAMPSFGWIFPVLFSAAGAALAAALVSRYAPETAGSGIPHLKAVLHRLRSLDWSRVLVVKMASGVLAIGSGLALGREGPTVQMGGAVGDGMARRLKGTPQDRLTLTAAGAGAGLAAAFNAPLSGLVFVLEEVRRDFSPAVFGAAFVAAAVADVVARLVSGQLPVLAVPNYAMPPLAALPAFALLGAFAGLLGVAFNKSLLAALDVMARFARTRTLLCVAVGALVGLVAWFYPLGVGTGHQLAETVLRGELNFAAVPALFLLRFVLTAASYGTGAAGGIFSPLLVLGALLGLGMGQIVHGGLLHGDRARAVDRHPPHHRNDRQLRANAAAADQQLLRLCGSRVRQRFSDLRGFAAARFAAWRHLCAQGTDRGRARSRRRRAVCGKAGAGFRIARRLRSCALLRGRP